VIYRTDPGRHTFGQAIGVLVLDALIPRPPGDVGNATTFPFPVRYEVVPRASIERLIQQRDPTLLGPFIEAGWRLIREGVRALTTTCGFLILFQEELADEFPVPVFASSLLQIPFIQRTLGRRGKLGLLTADAANLTEEHLAKAGADPERLVVLGLEDRPCFRAAILDGGGSLDFEAVQAEVVGRARELKARDEAIRALLLECANMPPYAAAIQEAVGLPVFDFNTMIGHVHAALIQRPYRGYV